ncbi:MAG: pyridoxamine 5'-phosphate oxidase family protein [Anaerolineales bacterium]|nr:pyridoxamine 5'-phosphate oxidase family protein [Anaerolineales bacterium]
MNQSDQTRNKPGRPAIPESYGISKQQSGLLDWHSVERRLIDARNYWLATASTAGRPHVAPIWGLWFQGDFYFATDPASRKARNLAENPRANLHLESGDEVVIVEGAVSVLPDRQLSAMLNRLYLEKYAVDLAGSPIHHLLPEKVLAWEEADFPNTATRWVISRR